MNAPHWHLALNHFPVVGMFFATALFAFASWRKSQEMSRTGLGFFVLVALISVPVYLTGEPAEMAIMDGPGFEETLVNAHQRAATFGFTAAIVVGVVALGALFVYRQAPMLPGWLKWTVLGLALMATAILGWTANLGGMIRHPEIRADSAAVQGKAGG